MFSWFKPKPTTKSSFEVKHKSGETITITVEGTNALFVSHILNKLKNSFDTPEPNHFNEMFDHFNKSFEELNKSFNKMDDIFKDKK